MRLHRLRLRAFGPFGGEHAVDFDRLGAGGLFLLDGPTGAGKSSVLDAITFALYGPGERGGDGRLHSHFAPAGLKPEVQLEFSVRGTRHRITRTPEYDRPKRRGSGTTRQAAKVHLERYEAGSWLSRSTHKAEVGELLADELGLTREQFTQVVLLPQGEFARFLRADDDDRRRLLSKLFGTRLYDLITEELDRHRGEVVKDRDAAEQRLRGCVAAAAEAAGLDGDARSDLVAADDLDGRLATLASDLRARATETAAVAGDRAAAVTAARAGHAAAEAAAERAARRAAAQTALDRHEQRAGEYEAWQLALDAGRRAAPVRPLLAALVEAEAEVSAARERVLAIEPAATEAMLAVTAAAELAVLVEQARTEAAELQHLVAAEARAAALDEAVAVAEGVARAAAGERDRIAARQAQLPPALEAASRELAAARERAGRLPGLRSARDALAARLAAAQLADDVGPQLSAAREAADLALATYRDRVRDHLHALEARVAGVAAELSAHLVDGEPCAVCGSREHPEPATGTAARVSAADVAAAAAVSAAAERARDATAARVAELERQYSAAHAVADGVPASVLADELNALDAEILACEAAAVATPQLDAAVGRVTAEADTLAAQFASARSAADAADAAVAAARAERDEQGATLAAAAGGAGSVAARQAELQTLAERGAALAAAVVELGAARTTVAKAVERATDEAHDSGFPTLAAARGAVLGGPELDRLAAACQDWAAERERLRAALAECGPADGTDLVAARAAAAAAGAQLAEAEVAAREAAGAADLARNAAARFAAACADVAQAQAELRVRDEQAAPVVYLAKLARGMTGQRRVALTTYVLRHWFERVVHAANARLVSMSSGRYELLRVDEGSSRNERTGLTLQVIDRHTGEQRSTRSLSGGETFYTSLALALGLADVVRAEAGGGELDTLFIDEGFGSLDSDTLEDVMAVIDDLRDRGRVVGIVSHVAELKARVAERLEVHRLPDGSSGLRVVA